MNEEQRTRIIEYNKKAALYKQAYEDIVLIVKQLEKAFDFFPLPIKRVIEKYSEQKNE